MLHLVDRPPRDGAREGPKEVEVLGMHLLTAAGKVKKKSAPSRDSSISRAVGRGSLLVEEQAETPAESCCRP